MTATGSLSRVGIFGGTFDPPHTGHLLAATDATEALALDRVWFVPNSVQPLKGAGHGSVHDRLEMVKRLVGNDARFSVDTIEIDRAGPSYTVDTLSEFSRRHPEAVRFLLVGADVTGTFDRWRDPQRIRELAEIVILRRTSDGVRSEVQGEASAAGSILSNARWLETRRIDISSTEIRERVRAGKSIRGFVPDAVAEYIAAAGLYR